MTNNRRFMVSLTPEIDAELKKLKKKEFYDKTQSEMVRYLISLGLSEKKKEKLSK